MKIPIAPEDFYTNWDSHINPVYVAALFFGETVSKHVDERFYTDEAIEFLNKNAEIIEHSSVAKYADDYNKQEKEAFLAKKKLIKGDEGINDFFSSDDFYPSSDRKASRIYKYKDNIIKQDCEDDGRNRLSWFYPASKKPDLDEFKGFVIPEDKEAAKVGILMLNGNGQLSVKTVSFDAPKFANDDILMNYGEKFDKIYENIVDKLNKISKGIIILRGAPGTGKTTMIKHLTTRVDRKFIFIPTGLSGELASPSFLTLLLNYKDSILVLEDAEQAVQSRESDLSNSSTCSTLLNISEGVISELLRISLILSYNTNNEKVDSALTRPGRLNFDYCFGPLSIKDGQKLADSLGKKITISKEMTLAEIYNIESDNNYSQPVQKKMGFGC